MTGHDEMAVLAGGCFWGMQDLIRKQPGVVSTRVGYTGGQNAHATYRNHPGHAEAIEITYDPDTTDYRTLLEFFFQIHDPTTKNRQGNDSGTSYRSAIFYLDDEQKRIALDTIADVDASGLWPGKVVTEVSPAGDFGRRSRSTRTTWSATRPAIRVTTCGQAGSCPTRAAFAVSHPRRRTPTMMGDHDRPTVIPLTADRRRTEHQTMPRDWQVLAAAYSPVLLYAVLRTTGRAAGWPRQHQKGDTRRLRIGNLPASIAAGVSAGRAGQTCPAIRCSRFTLDPPLVTVTFHRFWRLI